MTTVVYAETLGLDTDAAAQLAANKMAVQPSYFADVSCEGDAILGLTSHCTISCQSPSQTHRYQADPFNLCARNGLWSHLYRVQQELEAMVGWTLSSRYIVEEIPVKSGRQIQTQFGGVASVNYEELVSDIAGYGTVAYSVFLAQNLAPVLSGVDWYVDVNVNLLDNPGKLMLRVEDALGDPTNGLSVIEEDWKHKPQRVTVGPDTFWRIWIPDAAADAGVARFSAIHCEQSYFDAPDPSAVTCDGTIAPVHVGTSQRIPIIRTETLALGVVRYWVRTAHMINPAFDDGYTDISSGEFYKLVTEVDFLCFGEVNQLAVITKRIPMKPDDVGVSYFENVLDCDGVPCTTTEVYACATIIDGKRGIVALEEVDVTLDAQTGLPTRDPVTGDVIFTRRTSQCCYEGEAISVRLAYRTDPNLTGLNLSNAIETLRRAIACRVAAEVPLEECGCVVEAGFFFEMRQVMDTTIYTPTGSTIVSLRYGRKQGQMIFAHAVSTAPHIQRAVVI
jgi:hypothetical protein